MKDRLPIVAAIPNYNMGEQLRTLLPTVLEAGYDKVYVLDDHSSDDSIKIARSISPDIQVIAGTENKGAGANRNRILTALSQESIVHFLDADTTLDTPRFAGAIRDALPEGGFGFMVGLVRTPEGMQSVWNYGPRQSLWSGWGAFYQHKMNSLLTSDPNKAKHIRDKHPRLLADWPNPLTKPVRRSIYWGIESNLVVNSRVFKEIGGFDETMREHEIQDLAIRMSKKGLPRLFDPSFAVTQHTVNVRDYDRTRESNRIELRIARRHGLINWLFVPKDKQDRKV